MGTSFNQIQEQVEQPEYSHEGKVPFVSWTDELGRLRVWAANIGAHQTGQSSLDFRLRDASHISQQNTRLLKDLTQTLKDISEELSGYSLEPVEDDNSLDSWPDENSTSELQQLYEGVVNIIDCLYQMSMLIRKPAQHDLLTGSHKSDAAAFEPFDRDHVRNKYLNADNGIVHRLGRAITQRRKYLKYRDRHHAKLSKGIEEAQGIQRRATESLMSDTIATDFRNQNINFEETTSNSDMSQTSYAPSLMDGGVITIPSPPKESAAGKPFECPYCFFVINIKGTRSWTRHIFKDIKPYVCTFSGCSTPDRLYDSRREWFSHMTTDHQLDKSVCPLCKDTLRSTKKFERHIARHLEELALFALPRSEIEDEDDKEEEESNARSSLSEDNTALDGHDSDLSEDGEEAEEATEPNSYGLGGPAGIGAEEAERLKGPPGGHESLPGITNQTGTRGGSGFDGDGSTGSVVRNGDPSSDLAEIGDDGDYDASDFTKRLEAKKALESYNPRNDQAPTQYSIEDLEEIPLAPQGFLGRKDKMMEEGEHYYERRRVRESPEDLEDDEEDSVDTMTNDQTGRRGENGETEGPRDKRVRRQSSSGGYSDLEYETNMREFEELERQEEEAQKIERYKEELLLKEARNFKMKKEQEELKRKAVEEYSVAKRDEKKEKASEEGKGGLERPTYVKAHKKHLVPETLNAYGLPWEYDQLDSNYTIIKRWIPEHDQTILFEHTKVS